MFYTIKNYDDSEKSNDLSSLQSQVKELRIQDLGPNASCSNFELTTSSGKHLEDISHAHFVSLLFKITTIAKDSDGLSIGLDRDRRRRQQELPNYKHKW